MTREKLTYTSNISGITETENYIEFKVVALSATCVERIYGKLCFPPEVLEKKAKDLIEKPVLLDHEWKVSNIVGVVADAYFEDGKIIATLRITKSNKSLVELIKLKPSPIKCVSVGIFILRQEKAEDKVEVKDLEFVELSLVIKGADTNAQRLECERMVEKLNTARWWEDPELRKKAPRDYFLDPASRRFPYKTWDGKISCDRLKAAMSLASLHGYRQIYDRAKKLYERHCKK